MIHLKTLLGGAALALLFSLPAQAAEETKQANDNYAAGHVSGAPYYTYPDVPAEPLLLLGPLPAAAAAASVHSSQLEQEAQGLETAAAAQDPSPQVVQEAASKQGSGAASLGLAADEERKEDAPLAAGGVSGDPIYTIPGTVMPVQHRRPATSVLSSQLEQAATTEQRPAAPGNNLGPSSRFGLTGEAFTKAIADLQKERKKLKKKQKQKTPSKDRKARKKERRKKDAEIAAIEAKRKTEEEARAREIKASKRWPGVPVS